MDDIIDQLRQLEQPQIGNDADFVPRSYEEAVAERADRRRKALADRREASTQQSIVDNTTEDEQPRRPSTKLVVRDKQLGRPHGDHLDHTTEAKHSGAFYRSLKGQKQHSGAYFRRRRV